MDLNRATEVNEEVRSAIGDMFEYHPCDSDQQEHGRAVRQALEEAAVTIVAHVPPSPDRSTALRKLREARMDCNSAITHHGRY